MTKLVVFWKRGEGREIGTAEHPETFYDGDSPVSHPKFSDATLVENKLWVWQRQTTKRDGKAYGEDTLRHLRSWGITGSYSVI